MTVPTFSATEVMSSDRNPIQAEHKNHWKCCRSSEVAVEFMTGRNVTDATNNTNDYYANDHNHMIMVAHRVCRKSARLKGNADTGLKLSGFKESMAKIWAIGASHMGAGNGGNNYGPILFR